MTAAGLRPVADAKHQARPAEPIKRVEGRRSAAGLSPRAGWYNSVIRVGGRCAEVTSRIGARPGDGRFGVKTEGRLALASNYSLFATPYSLFASSM